MSPTRTLLLLGAEYPDLGEVATAELAPRVTAALSRGRYPKGYPHTDPNEDAVVAATEGEAWLVAVLDGHSGFDAAETAAQALVHAADELLGLEPAVAVAEAHRVALEAVWEHCGSRDDERRWSRTALAVAVTVVGEGAATAAGDSAAVVIGADRARPLTRSAPFLGLDYPAAHAPEVASFRLGEGDRVLCASDGLFDFLGREALHRLPELVDVDQPEVALVEAAFMGGAGDNVAVALLH